MLTLILHLNLKLLLLLLLLLTLQEPIISRSYKKREWLMNCMADMFAFIDGHYITPAMLSLWSRQQV
jgi:hypothetical protein